MPFRSPVSPPSANRPTPSWRWVIVLLASILLHLLILGWANGKLRFPAPSEEKEDIVTTVQLATPEATDKPDMLPALARSVAKPRRHHKPPAAKASEQQALPPTTEPTPQAASASEAASVPDMQTAPAAVAAGADDKVAEPTAAEATAPEPAAQDAAEPADPTPHYKVDLPPSVELEYDVSKVSETGTRYNGSGTISWQSADGNYQVNGNARVFGFLKLLHFKSEGRLDQYGVAPVLYNQKSFNRAETNTHFNRDERNSISFSSSKLSLPRKGGEQDRASVMWELAGIGRADRERFVPGGQIDLFVAGDRDGDVWRIVVVGEEEIEIGAGKTMAWHVVNKPRAGTYDAQIDIWLAPQYEWSPVKIHYTYKDGGYLDLSMSSFQQLQQANLH
jgi:Protein of unknown function (DUF3108)